MSPAETPALPATGDASPIPWAARITVLAGVAILAGITWDISWHSTIGRDTFWSPPHLCIHAGGVLGGLVCGWLLLRASFLGTPAERAAAVGFWGLRAPLGAWITLWGALAMVTSAPFDDWWHNAYGLDVEILSPPHTILAAGMYAHVWGGFLLVLGAQNRATRLGKPAGRGWLVLSAGTLLCLSATMFTELSLPNLMRTGTFLVTSSLAYPFLLVAAGRAARVSWPVTTVSLVYMLLMAAAVWILPLFPGSPMLGPIYLPLTRMAPPVFPFLMVLPALAIDLLLRYGQPGRRWWRDLLLAAALGTAFTAIFGLAHWHFGSFLLGPQADNWFFAGNQHWTFYTQPGPWLREFWKTTEDPIRTPAILRALAGAALTSYLGLLAGQWMTQVKR
ncbi:MAG: hypothetical protein RJA22_640 [Verrucomicrobiota bacterium]|jgi:hypothetical protein